MSIRRTVVPLATSAVLALTLAACGGTDDPDRAGASGDRTSSGSSPSAPVSTSTDAGSDPGDGTDPGEGGGDAATAVYFVTPGPLGDRLVREFQPGDADLASAVALLSGTPQDPDYSNPATGWVQGASQEGDEIVATVSGAAPGGDDAPLAVQQVVYTLQAAVGDTLPVRFVDADGGDVTVAGESNPVAAAPQLDTLLLVNVTDPAEGTTVSGSFTATGRASSFEANVPWELRSDGEVVDSGFVTHEGDWTTGLGPWEVTVDVSALAPGTYTFVARTDDPSGGEGPGPSEDTKTITVG
ncbi:Gmad2 immunoglobulin-like domain-containing protein [Nocardioides zeae]